jgi:murein L,D-transpeptidase YcbB/YkuD
MTCTLAALLAAGCSNFGESDLRREIRVALADSTVSASRLDKLRPYYEKRRFAPVWTANGALTREGATVVAALCEEGSHGMPASRLQEIYDNLHAAYVDIAPDAPARAQHVARAELDLSSAVLEMARGQLHGRASLPRSHRNWHYQVRDSTEPAAILSRFAATGNIDEMLRDLYEAHPAYLALEQSLERYRELAENGGWQPIPGAATLDPKSNGPRIDAVRARLALTGDLKNASDDLAEGVRQFQMRHGLEPSATIDRATLAAMNVPIEARIARMEVNLERERWLPRFDAERVVVNIPEYRLQAYRGGKLALAMNVIAGERMNQTPIFADDISYVSFRPYWNVPESIALGELVPKVQKDPGYLAKNDFEVVNAEGEVVEAPSRSGFLGILPASAGDDASGLADGIESGALQIRQRPGPANALGLVKFMFPNEYNIYLHHTPAEHLFGATQRDLSHGCIRVEDPVALAEFVLDRNGGWNSEKIASTMSDTAIVSRDVPLDQPIPVYIVYLTAWVDGDGQLQFRDDVYGHDAGVRRNMDEDSSAREREICGRLQELVATTRK